VAVNFHCHVSANSKAPIERTFYQSFNSGAGSPYPLYIIDCVINVMVETRAQVTEKFLSLPTELVFAVWELVGEPEQLQLFLVSRRWLQIWREKDMLFKGLISKRGVYGAMERLRGKAARFEKPADRKKKVNQERCRKEEVMWINK
jgi:hypothetical protein